MGFDGKYYDDDDELEFNPEDFDGEEIDDIDQLYEFEDYDYGDLVEYEFHGTGDTGGTE